MLQCYREILEKFAPVEPLWFSEHGVPRWVEFKPWEVDDIYATEVCLALICCQNCAKEFKVAFSIDQWEVEMRGHPSLSADIDKRILHYGDVPNVNCCGVGHTMNSVMVRILEYWERDWKRAMQRMGPCHNGFYRDTRREVEFTQGD